MSTQKRLITLCIATVFTLGLAACGGGGGGSPVTMMDDDTPMDESPMIVGQTIPSGTTITLPAGFELQDGTLSADMDETIIVEDIGTFTCVSADGCSVDLTGGVITTKGDITVVSLDVTDATILAQLADALPVEPTPAGGITLDAKAVAGAIGPDAKATKLPDALMIVNGVPGAKSPLEASDAVAAASIDGWTSSVTQQMTEAMGGIMASTDTVIIYNDQAARSRPMFSDRYPMYDYDTDGDGNADDALGITGGVDGNVGLISGVEEFPSAELQNAVPFKANTSYAGMLDGASGTFTCSGAGCTLSTDGDGKLSGVSSNNDNTPNWYFIPSDGATVDVNDYLRFGFWLNDSTDSDGDRSYDIDAFYGGALATPRAAGYQSANLRGTASYSGAATGAYMRKTFNEDSTVNPVAGGQFTATATLMANFAQLMTGGLSPQGTIAASLVRSISGNISNFMDGGEAIPGKWELELMRAPFDDSVDSENANEDFSGDTSGGEGTVPGKWAGKFFGTVTTDETGDTDENAAEYPTGVAGEFTGHFNTGHVIGAFGATVDDD